MTALALTYIRSLPIRLPQKINAAYLMYIGAAFLSTVLILLGASFAQSAWSACSTDESLLVYPQYSRKGIVTHYKELCGMPHATCILRKGSGETSTYDCSPFAIPAVANNIR